MLNDIQALAQALFIAKLQGQHRPSVKVIRALKRQAYKEANVFYEPAKCTEPVLEQHDSPC